MTETTITSDFLLSYWASRYCPLESILLKETLKDTPKTLIHSKLGLLCFVFVMCSKYAQSPFNSLCMHTLHILGSIALRMIFLTKLNTNSPACIYKTLKTNQCVWHLLEFFLLIMGTLLSHGKKMLSQIIYCSLFVSQSWDLPVTNRQCDFQICQRQKWGLGGRNGAIKGERHREIQCESVL